ncbi:TPA: hypothetical protein ENG04_01445 [Candidatus Poribacteria bacterium]|nr:hypothetical protein [Candidatus Poribacteria bacterium]HEX28725.1 hypothetical protein [Candidatus Poribacteria bacterium]
MWIAKPYQTEPKILEWARKFPDIVSLTYARTYTGMRTYAITVTDRREDDSSKLRHLFSQPHAHEPATTAGMMNFLSQIIEGVDLDGRRTDLDRETLLGKMILTFIPDGNPDGRSRAPVDWWDGNSYSNEEFLKIAFGICEDGDRCSRVGRWSLDERRPNFIGIVYEQINDKEFVEPNRDLESSFSKLVMKTVEEIGCHQYLALHQTEFERSRHNAMIILPFNFNDLPEDIRGYNGRWARAIIEAWRSIGADPIPDPKPLGYGEDQIRYFRKCWGKLYHRIPCLTVEVQNNNLRTPPHMQMRLIEVAIRASIQFLLSSSSIEPV